MPLPIEPSFWKTVWILLRAASRRAKGRRLRQRKLLNQRHGKISSNTAGSFGFLLGVVFMLGINGAAAFTLFVAIDSAQRIEVEQQGKTVVSGFFRRAVQNWIRSQTSGQPSPEALPDYAFEAKNIARQHGGSPNAIEQRLRSSVLAHGSEGLTSRSPSGLRAFNRAGPLPALAASIVLLWWGVMLVCQGEGLELDIQRSRHPMWEWLFSHPVEAAPVFLAEMLAPLAANPVYWGAPLFPAVVYGMVYGPAKGALALLLVGVPASVAAACLGKALEIGVMLRFSPRTRGAMIGLMSWAGYAALMLFLFGFRLAPAAMSAAAKPLLLLSKLPWPRALSPFSLFIGARADGSYSLARGMVACCIASAVCVAGAIALSVWGAQRGLAGVSSRLAPGPRRSAAWRFGKDPLFRKELLWFVRDRSAIVQSILIPLTIAGFQLFNLHGAFASAQGAWNYLCGAAILFGTYFLWVLGPKSLASEGQALWIPLSWPRGMESLLKAKAWLWSLIASGAVLLVLLYAVFVYPSDWWRIVLVGLGWFLFARSMADKSVTLVTVASESGEVQRIPWGRRAATQLGMLTFSIGVLTQQWRLAVAGIVYSWITSAAMWQNFRARLPFLFDPWSEKLPLPPTAMHAMVAISLLVDGGAVVSGAMLLIFGRDHSAMATAAGYAACSVLVGLGTARYLSQRYVEPHTVWNWTDRPGWDPNDLDTPEPPDIAWWQRWRLGERSFIPQLLVGVVGGVLLGLFAHAYQAALMHIPHIAEMLRTSQEELAKRPDWKLAFGITAVGFAPFAEEYLFRGLLYRALDREWGGWRAIVASAGLFAVYHQPLAWAPVALLGVTNALLFKKTGRLAPAVVLHMTYNAVVLLT